MGKRAIVTGATSFIGIYLIKELLKTNYTVVALIRPHSARKMLLNQMCPSVQVIECELNEIREVDLPLDSYDTLFHIAWSSDFVNSRYNRNGQLRNVDFCCYSVELAARYHCEKYLSIGSQAECGLVISPISSITRDNPITAYAEAKCIAYDKTKEMCKKNGIKQYWPRLLSAYGPYDRESTLISSCINACRNKRKVDLTPCEQIWDYIYISDVACAIVAIAEKGKPEKKYSIASGKGRVLKEYIQAIADVMNYPQLLEGIGNKGYEQNQVMYLVGDINEMKEEVGVEIRSSFRKGLITIINTI